MPYENTPANLTKWPASGIVPWLMSLSIHGALLVGVILGPPSTSEPAAADVRREGAIVLVSRSAGQADYFSNDGDSSQTGAAGVAASTTVSTDLPSDQPPTLGGPQLPAPQLPGSAISSVSASLGSGIAGQATIAPARPSGRGHDYGVETQVFGVRGKGTRFVYVFDRSSSMEGAPLAAAKRELIGSLQALQSVHQFQVIFYNQQPHVMPSFRGSAPEMVFGDDQGRRLAANFIGGIFADGGTDHMLALSMALRMQPDVIFFLTDADEPTLHRDDFARIERLNKGTTINAIEFGVGQPNRQYSFLAQLAAENGGQHTYVDVNRLHR